MKYQIVLASEELRCLRLMTRVMVMNRVFDKCQNYREKTRLFLIEGRDGDENAKLDMAFGQTVLSLFDAYRRVDAPLMQADSMSPDQTVILSLDEKDFNTLRGVANHSFDADPNNAETTAMLERFQKSQPSLKKRFEDAEVNLRTDVKANLPVAQGRN